MATNKITTDLEARGADKMSRDLAKVGDSAAKAGSQIEDLGADAKLASKGVDALGDEARGAVAPLAELGAEVGQVDRQIALLQQSVRDLAVEFDRTGDQSLLKDIGKNQRQTRKLIKISDLLPEPAEAAKGGMDLALSMISGAAQAIKGPGAPILAGVLVAAAVTAAPGIGAMMSGAVLGGVGAGGLIGGITLAAKDARVQAAGKEFADNAMADLQANIGQSFVGPSIAALTSLGETVKFAAQASGPAISALAGEVNGLTRGVDGFAKNVMPGAIKALNAARPIINMLGDELPGLGEDVGEALDAISDGGDGAVMALSGLIDTVGDVIVVTGKAIGTLGEMHETVVAVADSVIETADALPAWLQALGPLVPAMGVLNGLVDNQTKALGDATDETGSFAGGLHDVGNAAADATEQIDAMQTAMDELMGITMDIHKATIGYEQAIDDLAVELADGTRTFDAQTEAGRRNLEAVDQTIEAINRQREANIANNMSVAAANAIADQQLGKLDATVAKFGKTSAEVRAYIAEIRSIPTLAQLRIEVDGLAGAIKQMQALRRLLGSNVAAINEINDGEYISGRASGGPVQAGVPYIVGEKGPELIVPTQSGMVHTATQTAAIMSGSSGGSAMGGTQVIEHHHTVTLVLPSLVQTLRQDILLGGGNVQKFLGTG